MLRIITDFDGPIMDVSQRYYRVYQYCLETVQAPHQIVQPLSESEFWHCKRSQVPEREIGHRSGLDVEQAKAFARLRRKTIHTLPYLVYDRPVSSAIAALERIQSAQIDLVVMTMRRAQELEAVLEQHDLSRFFPPDRRYCLSNDYIKQADVTDKPLLMQQALSELPPAASTWMIGDTEADILAAQQHSLPAIAVLSGIRNRDRLAMHQPTLILPDLSAAVDLILQRALPTTAVCP
ncbi:MAG: HAD family hydrolase [Leptolyngbyaceae cyanobacterium SL_1_1]|nr:HAD family hydrolase [Leptolyngbyaceae cyanobacterium RM2_2_21]NJN01719.1 HAD family hydrolase [Leptolyngbyaceae cyanobacterium RM1_1_2]NJO09379.1 HAD family hydrolase [Leptolyngbyaceae cyanobacterium SL_1_1]